MKFWIGLNFEDEFKLKFKILNFADEKIGRLKLRIKT